MTARPATYVDIASNLVSFLADTNITLDSSNNVSKWVDTKSGLVAYQTYGDQYHPGYNTSARNGKPGLFFNGGQGLYTDANTIFPSGSAAMSVVLSMYQGATSSNQFAALWGSAAAQQLRAVGTDSGVPEFAGYGDDFDATGSIYQVDACVVITISGGANPVVNIWVNGVNVGSTTLSTALNTPSSSQLQIGGAGNVGNLYNGILQQLAIFSSVLSTADRQTAEGIESWSTGKNGANLPSSHPYKSSAPVITTGGDSSGTSSPTLRPTRYVGWPIRRHRPIILP